MNEIQRADIKTRRHFLLGMLVLFLAAVILSPILDNIEGWLGQDPKLLGQKIPIIVSGIALAFIPLLFMGFYCWRTGLAVIRSGRFPAPSMKVLVDTPIIRGQKALMRGRGLQLLGVLLSSSAIAFPVGFCFVLNQIVGHS